MNYQDEERELDAQIRAELQRLREASKTPLGNALNPAELRSLFQNIQVRKVARKLPVSSYIRKIRTYAEATLENFAAALNVSPEFIRQLETNESEPWILSPAIMAQVAQGLTIHMNALEVLIQNSYTIARLSRTLSDPENSLQLMASWLKEVRSELQRRGATELLD